VPKLKVSGGGASEGTEATEGTEGTMKSVSRCTRECIPVPSVPSVPSAPLPVPPRPFGPFSPFRPFSPAAPSAPASLPSLPPRPSLQPPVGIASGRPIRASQKRRSQLTRAPPRQPRSRVPGRWSASKTATGAAPDALREIARLHIFIRVHSCHSWLRIPAALG
jgi:hypothetical protein